MNEIIFSICICAVITAIFKMLIPSDKFEKQVKLVISCFFVVSVMTLAGEGVGIDDLRDIFNTDIEYVDYSAEFYKLTADEVADELRQRIRDKLQQEGISSEKIYIGVNISDSGSISISEIGLVLEEFNEYDAERAVMITRSLVGKETEVEVE